MSPRSYDIIVVGGGHAGIEAALAAARLGARAALVTHDPAEVGRMPCNPAIGGLGKGHLVREIDVLGGEMGLAIDQSGIQFRLLNTKKGPAVQSPRAQADKHRYQDLMAAIVRDQPGLDVICGDAAGLDVEDHPSEEDRRQIRGVLLADGSHLRASRVVLCTGTFMKGLMHVGDRRTIGGREGAASSEGLSGSLRDYGFELKRLKTGTPPRLRAGTIDFNQLKEQPGDIDPSPFSFRTKEFAPTQIKCHMAYTNAETHRIIQENLGTSPLFGGMIAGQGPRYCPSIEDKVVRFADKERHLLFLEPEGLDTDEIYVNGLSTSLPAGVQEKVVRSVPGLERAELIRFGYAVEYDSVPSWYIKRSLETKPVAGLYLAGQILGTSGYEEAAAQGLVAGANAVRSLGGADPVAIGREEGYVGVLVDDLVTKDINEPYRMFTSRAEHRLHLRCDNTEDRLLGRAREIGLLDAGSLGILEARRAFVGDVKRLLSRTRMILQDKGLRVSAAEWMRFPEARLAELGDRPEINHEYRDGLESIISEFKQVNPPAHVMSGAFDQVQNDIKYEGYINKHNRLLKSRVHLDNLEMPAQLDYKSLTALSFESREKLDRIRPATLGEAARIDGVRAGDLAVLTVILKKLEDPGGRP